MSEQRQERPQTQRGSASDADDKQSWEEPKLTFVEPVLVKHGDLKQITAQFGFIGTFVPGD